MVTIKDFGMVFYLGNNMHEVGESLVVYMKMDDNRDRRLLIDMDIEIVMDTDPFLLKNFVLNFR